MLRDELYHPIFAHFPIALLSLLPIAIICRLYFFYTKNPKEATAEVIFKLLLYLGLGSYLVTLYLGDMALEVVKNNLCKLYEAYNHEEYAYNTLYIFAFILILDFITHIERFRPHKRNIFIALTLLSFATTFSLFQVGHSGASLVYEQGAAVENHQMNCQ